MLILIFLISAALMSVDCEKYEGDQCVLTGTGQNGTCVLIDKCTSALDGVRLGKLPEICGFISESKQIVCCADKPVTANVAVPGTEYDSIQKKPNDVGFKSNTNCREYAKSVYKVSKLPTLGLQTNATQDTCGITSTPLIVAGYDAFAKQFPHMALLGYKTDDGSITYLCSGSLISDQYILTAAHCTNTREYGQVQYVRLGDLDLTRTDDDADPQDFLVKKVVRHPNFKPPSMYHDIALIQLDKRVVFNAHVRPICLNTNSEIQAKKVISTGWGRTSFHSDRSSTLQNVQLEIYTADECKNAYDKNRKLKDGILDAMQLCAGSKVGLDTCQGDSGGPLQIYNDDVYCMYTQIGVTSFGKTCGIATHPDVFTRVSNYVEWIESVVWP